jgi:hypothetical protein
VRIAGIWWCRGCERDRTFTFEEQNVNDPDLAECSECFYTYGKIIDETEPDLAKRVKNNLPRDTCAKGLSRFNARNEIMRAKDGIPSPAELGKPAMHELRRRADG